MNYDHALYKTFATDLMFHSGGNQRRRDFYHTCNKSFLAGLNKKGRRLIEAGELAEFARKYPTKEGELMQELEAFTATLVIMFEANEHAKLNGGRAAGGA